MVVPKTAMRSRPSGGGAAPATSEPSYALFVGGWGEDGRAIRSVLKLYFENSLSGSGGGPVAAGNTKNRESTAGPGHRSGK